MAGYQYFGSRVYFLKNDGHVVYRTPSGEGWFSKIIEAHEDYDYYTELQKYDKEVLDYIQLEYGEFRTEFAECTDYHVDIETRKLVFEYGEIPQAPDVPVAPSIHERVDTLEKEQANLLLESAQASINAEQLEAMNAQLTLDSANYTIEIENLKAEVEALKAAKQ